MGEPKTILGLTLAQMAAGAAVAGSAVSAVGAIRSGNAANQQARAQAQVMGQQATSERAAAAASESDFRRRQSAMFASRRAAGGATGVDLAAGSPLLVSEDFAAESELQALRIRAGGETRATRLEQQAGLTRQSGRDARTSGFFRGGASVLSGLGTAFGRSTPKKKK